MNISLTRLILGLFFGLLLGACSSSKSVTHDYDREAPVETYYTYQIVRPSGSELTHLPNLQQRDLDVIESLIKDEMEKINSLPVKTLISWWVITSPPKRPPGLLQPEPRLASGLEVLSWDWDIALVPTALTM